MKILLTGFTGFIGRNLCNKLSEIGHEVICAGRKKSQIPDGFSYFKVNSIDASTDWKPALLDVDVVIHLAALAHDERVNVWQDYYNVNFLGATNLARQFSQVRGKRFIFLSSIGVNGSESDSAFTHLDYPSPKGYYAKSKLLAELALQEIAMKTDVELVVIRPPLVYGPGAPGNFHRLIGISPSFPLPLGAVFNKRSLIGIDNLLDLIVRCIDHPAAANQIFLASDGEDLSTTDLLRRIAIARGRPYRLLSIPTFLLKLGASMVGKRAMAQRLLGSLQVDISKTRELLGWVPPVSVDEGFRRCFIEQRDKV